jgi:hypothetical protein
MVALNNSSIILFYLIFVGMNSGGALNAFANNNSLTVSNQVDNNGY